MMRCWLWCIPLAALFVLGSAVCSADADQEPDKLKGTWEVVGTIVDGTPIPKDKLSSQF